MITAEQRAELEREWGTKTYIFGYDERLGDKPYTLQPVGTKQISTHPTLESAEHSARVRGSAPRATPDPERDFDDRAQMF